MSARASMVPRPPVRSLSSIRPLVKICGVTTPEDALLAARLGAHLVGLNFHPPSPRCLTAEAAREIAHRLAAEHPEVLRVGLFVDRSSQEMRAMAEAVGLDWIQLHGDEPPEVLAGLDLPVLRAFRGPLPSAEVLAAWSGAAAFLVDTPDELSGAADLPGTTHGLAYGGTGQTWEYHLGEAAAEILAGRPVLVAGGVGPEATAPGTLARAFAVPGAAGVDLCSRIESSPGVKDPGLMNQLFEEIRHGQAFPRP